MKSGEWAPLGSFILWEITLLTGWSSAYHWVIGCYRYFVILFLAFSKTTHLAKEVVFFICPFQYPTPNRLPPPLKAGIQECEEKKEVHKQIVLTLKLKQVRTGGNTLFFIEQFNQVTLS